MSFIEPIFFRAAGGTRLHGVWRTSSPNSTPQRVWVVCPPFAEEEKSAHRTLVELADALVAKGDAVLLLALRGTGDSEGGFVEASLTAWCEDILHASEYAHVRFPHSALGFIGLRLGASMAAQVGEQVGVQNLLLIEPVLRGRSFLMQLGARKKIRAAMTSEEAGQAEDSGQPAAADADNEDLDGWPLGEAMRQELRVLDLHAHPPKIAGKVLVLQAGAREKVAPPLEQFAQALNPDSSTRAVVMPPFWNRLDLLDSAPLLEAVSSFEFEASAATDHGCQAEVAPCENGSERAFTFKNAATQVLVATSHRPQIQNPDSQFSTPQLIFLHGWTGYRTGPHQMLTRASRYFAGKEIASLRFDFAGRGDSEGEADMSTLATMADDARVAISHVRQQNPEAPIILVGLCSGCEIAFAVAAEPGVAGLALWSAPVFAAGQSQERVARKRSRHLKDYARKMMRPATWGKVLSGRLDLKGVRKVMGQGGGEEWKNAETGDPGFLPPGWRGEAMARFESVRVPSLLVYGTADPTTAEALAWYRGQMRQAPEVHLVPGANHSYYGLEWEQQVFAATHGWLARFLRTSSE